MKMKWANEVTIREIFLKNEEGTTFKIKITHELVGHKAIEYYQMDPVTGTYWPIINDAAKKIAALNAYLDESAAAGR